MNSIPKIRLNVFYKNDLDEVLLHRWEKYGASIYKGVLVIWDEDRDDRILRFIRKNVSSVERFFLLMAHEHEGGLDLLWSEDCPTSFMRNVNSEVDGDHWEILSSGTARAQ